MQGEFDYDESVDVFLHVEGAAPVAMRGVSLARAIQVVVDQWPPSGECSVLINRDGPDITSHDEVQAIYKRDDFPRAPKPNKAPESLGCTLMSNPPNPTDSCLNSDAPPSTLSAPIQALWWAARGSWDRAHSLVQDDGSAEAAWVHAHLHRIEGDLAYASCWYRKAGRKVSGDHLETERNSIVAELIRSSV